MAVINDLTLRLGRTTTRGRRDENQDREGTFQCPLGEGFLVADGMGGYEGGATAAQIVVSRLPALLQELPPEADVRQAISEATRRLNEEVHEAQRSDEHLRQMGSTMVLALWRRNELWVAHVGDSRAYLFRDAILQRLTTDHTVAQQTIGATGASDEEVRQHPGASILTRVIGQAGEVTPEILGPFELLQGDGLLLCSDGLSGYATDQQIQDLLRQGGEAAVLSQRLQEMALEIGSSDNVTIQYLQMLPVMPEVQPAAAARRRWLWLTVWLFVAFAVGWGVWSITARTRQGGKAVQELKVNPD